VTTHTTGHATHASSTTYSSRQTSQLSSISETDREVMELNKGGSLSPKDDQLLRSIPLSSARDARYAGYTSLEKSQVPLRDGANVPADRFFTFVDTQILDKRTSSRQTTSTSSRKSTSRSPSISSSSMNTSSTGSTLGDEPPPIFVSYLDRKTISDLTSRFETSSPRAGQESKEQRESSSSDKLLAGITVHPTVSKKPRPIWPTKGFHYGKRVGSLPPRSPVKGTSPDSLHLRSILDDSVDHHGEQDIVRINTYQTTIQRSSPTSSSLRSRTYDELSIEILKTDSKEESQASLL